jgi:hypothetical protein
MMESKLWSGVLKPFFPSSKGKKESSTHYNYKDTNFNKSFKLNSQWEDDDVIKTPNRKK